jgi:ribose transport system substrate-binding protein
MHRPTMFGRKKRLGNQSRSVKNYGAIFIISAASCMGFYGGITAHAKEANRILAGIDETASEYWAEYIAGVQSVSDSVHKHATVLVSNYQGSQLLAQLGAVYATGAQNSALVVDPSSNAFVKAVVDQAAKAQVYTVTLWNRPEDLHPWDTASKYWVAHTSFDGVVTGYELGKELCKALNGKGYIAAISGVPSTTPAYQRLAGLHKALEEFPDVKLIDIQDGEWQEVVAQKITRTWIARYGNKLNGIFGSNDIMARGAIAALKERGLNGKIFVTGSDGASNALELIKNGDMLATEWNDPTLQGAVTTAIAYAAAAGDIDPEKLTQAQRDFYLQEEVVNKDNVDKFIALKKTDRKFDYNDMKSDLWKYSAGQIPVGAQVPVDSSKFINGHL